MHAPAPNSVKSRLGSPISMLFTLLLFCLPWMEVSCKDGNQVRRISQSGLQIAFGGHTESVNDEVVSRTIFVQDRQVRRDQEEQIVSWAMVFYLLLLAGGIIGGLVIPLGAGRANLVSLCNVLMFLPLMYAGYYLNNQLSGRGADFRILPWYYLSYLTVIVTLAIVAAERMFLTQSGEAQGQSNTGPNAGP